MTPSLVRFVYYDSRRHAEPRLADLAGATSSEPGSPEAAGSEPRDAASTLAATLIDVSADPEAAQHLLRLGISSERDLPALALAEPGGKVRLLGLRLSPVEIDRLAGGKGLQPERLVVYSSSWCPDCRNAKRVLNEAETSFDEIDIDQDPVAEALVLERSGGRRVVPTLRFGDRLWAFNPAPPLLRRLLASGV